MASRSHSIRKTTQGFKRRRPSIRTKWRRPCSTTRGSICFDAWAGRLHQPRLYNCTGISADAKGFLWLKLPSRLDVILSLSLHSSRLCFALAAGCVRGSSSVDAAAKEPVYKLFCEVDASLPAIATQPAIAACERASM